MVTPKSRYTAANRRYGYSTACGQKPNAATPHLLQRAVGVERLPLAIAVQADVPKFDLLFHIAQQTLGVRQILHVRDEKSDARDRLAHAILNTKKKATKKVNV